MADALRIMLVDDHLLFRKEIAATLHITENTVKIHLRNILEKLHVQNRIQAAVRAVHTGLVEEEAFEDV